MQDIDTMVKQVAKNLGVATKVDKPIEQKPAPQPIEKIADKKEAKASAPIKTASGISINDYPLAENMPDKIKGLTGKGPQEITIDKVVADEVVPEDVRISPDVLKMQADIAESNGKKQLAESLRRAAEMTAIPDDRVLEIYNMLRPNRSTKAQLLEIADELEKVYKAVETAKFVRGAVEVYNKRGILLK